MIFISLFILLPGKDLHVLTNIQLLDYSNLLNFELLLFLSKKGHIGYKSDTNNLLPRFLRPGLEHSSQHYSYHVNSD